MSKKDKTIKSVKGTIFDFLEKDLGFTRGEGNSEFIKSFPGQTHQVFINGQSSIQQDPEKIVKIEYRGDGKITSADGTEEEIYGFTTYVDGIQVGSTNYVDCLEDFKRFIAN